MCQKCVCGRGFGLDPAGGAYSAPPDSLAGFKGPTSKGRVREGERRGKGKEGGRRRKEGGGREGIGSYRNFFSPLRALG